MAQAPNRYGRQGTAFLSLPLCLPCTNLNATASSKVDTVDDLMQGDGGASAGAFSAAVTKAGGGGGGSSKTPLPSRGGAKAAQMAAARKEATARERHAKSAAAKSEGTLGGGNFVKHKKGTWNPSLSRGTKVGPSNGAGAGGGGFGSRGKAYKAAGNVLRLSLCLSLFALRN